MLTSVSQLKTQVLRFLLPGVSFLSQLVNVDLHALELLDESGCLGNTVKEVLHFYE